MEIKDVPFFVVASTSVLGTFQRGVVFLVGKETVVRRVAKLGLATYVIHIREFDFTIDEDELDQLEVLHDEGTERGNAEEAKQFCKANGNLREME